MLSSMCQHVGADKIAVWVSCAKKTQPLWNSQMIWWWDCHKALTTGLDQCHINSVCSQSAKAPPIEAGAKLLCNLNLIHVTTNSRRWFMQVCLMSLLTKAWPLFRRIKEHFCRGELFRSWAPRIWKICYAHSGGLCPFQKFFCNSSVAGNSHNLSIACPYLRCYNAICPFSQKAARSNPPRAVQIENCQPISMHLSSDPNDLEVHCGQIWSMGNGLSANPECLEGSPTQG